MTFDDYFRWAMVTDNPDAPAAMYGLGIAGEAGEVADLIKKWEYHGTDKDANQLVKELGDVLWYVAGICNFYGFSMDDVAQANLDKLAARYPEGFRLGGGLRDD